MRSSPDRRRDLRPQPARPETPSTPRLIRQQPPYQPSPTLPYSGQTTHVRKRALKSRRPVSSDELGQASPQPVSTRTLPRSGTQHPCFPKLHCPRPTSALSATTANTTSLHRHKSLRPDPRTARAMPRCFSTMAVRPPAERYPPTRVENCSSTRSPSPIEDSSSNSPSRQFE